MFTLSSTASDELSAAIVLLPSVNHLSLHCVLLWLSFFAHVLLFALVQVDRTGLLHPNGSCAWLL